MSPSRTPDRLWEPAIATLRTLPGPPLVAVSGGADSVALLHLTALHRSDARAAHVWHGLRPEAEQDAELVRSVCASLGVPLTVLRVDPAALRADPHGIEAGARRARYNSLAHEAAQDGAIILTAHHAQDRLETTLLRIGEGCGVAGLAGPLSVTTWNDARIVRPLLSVWHEDLVAWCSQHGLPWVEDAMNADPRFRRSRLRLQAMPALLAELDRGATVRSLAQLAEDAALLHELIEDQLTPRLQVQGGGVVALGREGLDLLRPSLVRAMIWRCARLAVSHVDPTARTEAHTVDAILARLQRPGPATILGHRLAVRIERGRLLFAGTSDPRNHRFDVEEGERGNG